MPTDDLFERTAGLYAFFRERIFRDDTDQIATSLWPAGAIQPGALLLEVGCGPGLYARRLARRYPGLRTVGIDRSRRLLTLARERAAADGLVNCRFERGDALALAWPDASVNAVVASRLFTVVDASRVVAEIHRVLRPGGRCFLAEPQSSIASLLPYLALRLAGLLTGPAGDDGPAGESGAERCETTLPWRPTSLTTDRFEALISSQTWGKTVLSRQHGYQYAVCTKLAGLAR